MMARSTNAHPQYPETQHFFQRNIGRDRSIHGPDTEAHLYGPAVCCKPNVTDGDDMTRTSLKDQV